MYSNPVLQHLVRKGYSIHQTILQLHMISSIVACISSENIQIIKVTSRMFSFAYSYVSSLNVKICSNIHFYI